MNGFTMTEGTKSLSAMAVAFGVCALCCVACDERPTAPSAQTVLLRDDFGGTSLDTSKWFVPTGPGSFLGRTQIRPPSEPFDVFQGLLHLRLDTYNPTARIEGDSFWGSEIASHQVFDRGAGLAFHARVRMVPPISGGIVASLFSYGTRNSLRDEIDFEILSSDVARGNSRVLTNLFNDAPFSVAGSPRFALSPGLNANSFLDFEIRWRSDRVQWFIDSLLVREETQDLPDDPMSMRLNIWAPDASFANAYDSDLRPAPTAASNMTFFYEIDLVEVRAIP